jgi:hypothetical protein
MLPPIKQGTDYVMKDHQQERQMLEASEEKTRGEGEKGSRVEG